MEKETYETIQQLFRDVDLSIQQCLNFFQDEQYEELKNKLQDAEAILEEVKTKYRRAEGSSDQLETMIL